MSRTALILIGASEFIHWPERSNERFRRASKSFKSAIEDIGIAGSDSVISLDLFDHDLSGPDIIDQSVLFIRDDDITNVIVHYCGHGQSSKNRSNLLLMLRGTKKNSTAASSLRIVDFWDGIESAVLDKRLYVVIDSCYSGTASREFQDIIPGTFTEELLTQNMPSGVSVVSSTDGRNVGLALDGSDTTLFTGAIESVISSGIPELENYEYFTWNRLIDRVRVTQLRLIGERAPRPKIINVGQDWGDINRIPFFLNRSAVTGHRVTRQKWQDDARSAIERRYALDKQKHEEEIKAAAERKKQDENARIATKNRRDEEDKAAAERKRLEDEAKAAAERKRLENEAKAAAERKKYEAALKETRRNRLAKRLRDVHQYLRQNEMSYIVSLLDVDPNYAEKKIASAEAAMRNANAAALAAQARNPGKLHTGNKKLVHIILSVFTMFFLFIICIHLLGKAN